MSTERPVESDSSSRRRIGRVLWVVGWCLLLVLSASATYAGMVIAGK
jgi:hypothetical protein